MTDKEQIKAAKEFSKTWSGIGNEEQHTQKFWLALLQNVFGVKDWSDDIINFEKPVDGRFMDAFMHKAKVLIEQKSYRGDLAAAYEQAKNYVKLYNRSGDISYSERIRWIVTCNFGEFEIYEVNDDCLIGEPDIEKIISIPLQELHMNLDFLNFLVDPNDDSKRKAVKISGNAAELIRKIRDSFIENYNKNKQTNYRESLMRICVRLVFCFYAADAKIFPDDKFMRYINSFPVSVRNEAIQKLFEVLNLKEDSRPADLDEKLAEFPYVNGGLFSESVTLPKFNKNINSPIEVAAYLDETKKFNWHTIHPAIFGSMFESILGKAEQRKGGMHYTGTKNIDKVIDPLFMNELREKFKNIMTRHKKSVRAQELRYLQNKMANMLFFDPACGSGNFLTEIYIKLRELENDIILALNNECNDGKDISIKVSIQQFFGIEINSYAVAISKLALWISENQMFRKISAIVDREATGLPLCEINNVHCANALQIDWEKVLPKNKFAGKQIFIIGNPPFVGYTYQSAQQKTDLQNATGLKTTKLDYVVSWYYKAADFIQGTDIRCAFVSTNSICQGEQVAPVWKPLFAQGIHFDFAYQTFRWTSESDKMAAVHCVIIGFSQNYKGKKFLWLSGNDEPITVKNITPYLTEGETVFIESRTKPICPVPEMKKGSMPNDGGNFIIKAEDYADFIKREPRAEKYIHPLIGAEEFINGKMRYCLWLVNCSDEEIKSMPLVAERVKGVINHRLKSTAASTRKAAETPTLFYQNAQPKTDYLLVPSVSSENRRYIPMGFVDSNVIATNLALIIPDATIYNFGVLISSVHMAWVRAVCGRLESRYRYSKDIVYNNFVWCECTPEQRAEIERTAQKILDALKKYSDWTLAKLYNEATMPDDLRAAHLANDAAVLAAYGFGADMSESEIVAELFKKYKVRAGGGKNLIADNFMSMEITAGEILRLLELARYYNFGVLTSSVHMAWVRAVCGRLKSDYRYSKDIVYNNFPFCAAAAEQKISIGLAAEKILQVRAGHAGKTLAFLYNDATMPDDLRAAHLANDAAVLAAYGFGADMSESEIVSALMEKYLQLTK